MTHRVALVTGGSGGIGRAVAGRLAADGFDVAVHYLGNADRAEEVAAEVRERGRKAVTVRADLGDEESALALFGTVETELGGVDAVVHTAGIMPLSPLAETDLETFDRVMRANLRGTFLVAREGARRVRAGGSIVLFSTSITRLQTPAYGAYAMSKGAVEALPLILARELAGRDVTVNAVAPGPTDTPLFREGKPQELIDRIAGLNPAGRLGTPDDVAEVVAALVGPARWINGQTIFANGGAA
ncbi:SDR family oxidoreductase [Luteimicrobium sp. NPDC057192]|uniref:SDR family oxidoreductase n=1 Tax=Luteimicrobium sp. NPDC057192 TaxID=3346042 RepID=UPI003644A22C